MLFFGCQYQCNRLSAKICPRNDLSCVESGVKPDTLTHFLQNDSWGISCDDDMMMIMLPICHSQWMWTSPATFIVSAETATCKVLRHWTKLWPTLKNRSITNTIAGWLVEINWIYHPQLWLVGSVFGYVCLSVCLSCLCSNLWKPWPRNFIFGEQAHLDQGRWVKVTWAKNHTSVIIIIIQHFYSAYRVRGYKGAGCARLSPCEQMSLEMSLECL